MPSDNVRGPAAWAAHVDYAQAVTAGGLVFVSGQYASADDGSVVSDDFREQARTTFANLRAVLAEAGAGLTDLVHIRCFLLHVDDFGAYKEVRREFLEEPYPASLVVGVAGFTFPGMLIEIEAVAQLR